jgi:hypothetical protein
VAEGVSKKKETPTAENAENAEKKNSTAEAAEGAEKYPAPSAFSALSAVKKQMDAAPPLRARRNAIARA